jgi:hypothetical protein
MIRQASAIVSAVEEFGPSVECGLHRRQGRKPASVAEKESLKKTAFNRSGLREGHVGRQKILVDLTPYTNSEPATGFRSRTACHFSSTWRNAKSRVSEVERDVVIVVDSGHRKGFCQEESVVSWSTMGIYHRANRRWFSCSQSGPISNHQIPPVHAMRSPSGGNHTNGRGHPQR